MLTRTSKIICDSCGKFIALHDLVTGKAWHVMTRPDAYGSEETFESECRRCAALTAHKETP